MIDYSPNESQIEYVKSFEELVTKSFHGLMNALCWKRELEGDFYEIIRQVELTENIVVLEMEQLIDLRLSKQGQVARELILQDYTLLKEHGASPTLNIIKYYERDENYPAFPTDVYSFHVDRSPIPSDTFLCTYYGESSELISNAEAIQKISVPEIRAELKKLYHGNEEGFESFLSEHFFDLHYNATPHAQPFRLGTGHLWRLAVDHPESTCLPCVHRAPKEKPGEPRLLMIC